MIRTLVAAAAAVAALASAGEAAPGGAAGEPVVDLEAIVKPAPRCEAGRAHCLGIKLHVAVGDSGAVATADWVTAQLVQANRHFAAIGVGFQIEAVGALPASAARIEDAKERSSLAALVGGTVIDVFVTAHLDDIDKERDYIYGVAWPKGARKYVIISTMARDRVLAHELGHVFGLPHSKYPISIMNKADRKEPPIEQRTFHDDELAIMRGQLQRMLREKIVASLPVAKPAPAK